VASGTSSAPVELTSYNGTAGTYRYRVHAYSGSGTYTIGIQQP
jgi:streptogrisin C